MPPSHAASNRKAAHASTETLVSLLKKHLKATVKPGARVDDVDSQTTYTISAGGMTGTMSEYMSPPRRFRVDFSLGPISMTIADDGKTGWERDTTGNLRILRGAELTENRAAQNFSLETYDPKKPGKGTTVTLRPDREPGTGNYIIDVKPAGGSTQTIFLNPRTYLIDAIISHKGGMAGTVHMRKYREVAGVMVPSLLEIGYAGLPVVVTAELQTAKQGVTLNPAVFRAPATKKDYEFLASAPADPATTNPDEAPADPAAERTTVTIPFSMQDNEIVIPITINGKKRNFILDSGAGSSFITGGAAEDVGLKTQGDLAAVGYGGSATTGIAAKTTVQIADAIKINGLSLYVVRDAGIAKMLSDRAGVDGALGYDVFARFIVTLDYQKKTVTFTAPSSTAKPVAAIGKSIRLPIKLEMHTPTIQASIDGKRAGQFLLDTGDAGSVHLFDKYAEANGLKASATSPGASVRAGVGIGGVMMEIITPKHSVNLGGHVVQSVSVATLAGKGVNGISEMAGGIGNGILSKFLVTIDYDAGLITLVPTTPEIKTPPAAAPAPNAEPAAAAAMSLPFFNKALFAYPSVMLAGALSVPGKSAIVAAAAKAQPAGLTLDQLMQRHLTALGGRAAVENIKTTRVTSTISTGGETGTVQSTYKSPGKEFEDDKIGLMHVQQGFDGKTAWQQDSNGNLRNLGGDELADLEDQLFFDTNSYVLGGPKHGKISLRPKREAGTGNFILDALPEGGKPCIIYLHPKTYLIVKEQHYNDDVLTTTFFTGYKRVDGVMFPTIQTQTNGNSRYDLKLTVNKIENNIEVSDSLFMAPTANLNAGFIKPGATSATVPFDFDDGEIAFSATINGQHERLLFDSGASTLAISTDEAKKLHLKQGGILEARGYGGSVDLHPVQIDTFEIPDAIRITSITGAAIPFSPGLGDLEHGPVVGFAGYDILSRFVVRVDYAKRQLTFIDPKSFKPTNADGEIIPAVISDDIPTVMGTVDGVGPVKFLVDTGDVARLRLYGPFVKKNGFDTKYPNGVLNAGGGIGGRSDSRQVKVKSLKIGSTNLSYVPTDLSLDLKGGSSVLNAGSVGSGLLSRFVVTFDYPHNRIFLAKLSNTEEPIETRVLGLYLEQEDQPKAEPRIVVQEMEPKAPAKKSGLQVGDQITAVDGNSVAGMPLPKVLELLHARPGRDEVALTVKNKAGQVRQLTVRYFDPLS